MENARLVLDYIDVLIYPLVILVLGGGSLLLFRTQIASFIGTVKEASFGPAAVKAEPQTSQPTELLTESDEIDPQEQDLTSVPFEMWAALVDERNQFWEELLFERVFRLIYGSQLQTLQFLELERKQGPARRLWTLDQLRGFHYQHRQSTPTPVSVDAWVDFLTRSAELVQKVSADGYTISQRGHDFLLYLLRSGIWPVKAY